MFGSLFKGWLGEKGTQFGLWHHLNDQTYLRFHDVMVLARNGTTQIDHMLVSCYGTIRISRPLRSRRRGAERSKVRTYIRLFSPRLCVSARNLKMDQLNLANDAVGT